MFEKKRVAQDKIIQEWFCMEHLLPDKPVACWHDKNHPGVCFSLTISNINYWVSHIVCCFNYPLWFNTNIILFADFGSQCILRAWKTTPTQSHSKPFIRVKAISCLCPSTACIYTLSILPGSLYILPSAPMACKPKPKPSNLDITTCWSSPKPKWLVKVSQRPGYIHLAAILWQPSQPWWRQFGCTHY